MLIELERLLSEGYTVTLTPHNGEITITVSLVGRPTIKGRHIVPGNEIVATETQTTLDGAIEAVYTQVPVR